MAKPDLIKWVSGDESAKITDPGSSKKLAGFLYLEKVAMQQLNWLFNRVDKWLKGLQGSYYDVIVGSAAQVTALEATHVLDDLDDTLVTAGTKVLILDGTHTLLSNFLLSNNNIKLQSETVNAIIDVSTFTFTLSGNNVDAELKINNSGIDDIIISGIGSFFKGIDLNINNIPDNDNSIIITTGEFGGIKTKVIPNWTSPVEIGAGLTLATMGAPAVTTLNTTDIALSATGLNELRTYRWNGATWALVGSGFAVSGMSTPSITALNTTDIAFIDVGNDELRTYRFNGSTWSLVGSGLAITIGGGTVPDITALNATDIAMFVADSNPELRTYRWGGSTWSQVGNSLIVSAASLASITPLNATDIAFIDIGNHELRTYRFDGTDWSLVGSGLAISGVAAYSITALNTTDIALIDATNDELRTYRFNGTDWSLVGSGLAITSVGAPAITPLNGTDVAFVGSTGIELRTYRFGFSL